MRVHIRLGLSDNPQIFAQNCPCFRVRPLASGRVLGITGAAKAILGVSMLTDVKVRNAEPQGKDFKLFDQRGYIFVSQPKARLNCRAFSHWRVDA